MVQIEKRKKKGRPSKADLAARTRAALSAASPDDSDHHQQQRDLRRSSRRRTFRYNIIDYDEDYLDDGDELFEEEMQQQQQGDDEDEDEDDEERREKKVKLVVKLNGNENSKGKRGTSRRGRVVASHDSDGEDEEDDRVLKKRRISRRQEEKEDDDDDDAEEYGYDEDDDDVENGENDEGRERKGGAKREDYNAPGTPTTKKYDDDNGDGDNDDRRPSSTPMPDKKQLEIILDKLQKKDTYGVYAEPVDPDELPDYHEVIEHPMDFSTVRTKLADGSYSTLEEFESDVYLISSNAMQYNAPDTIYHKQARTIKELAEKKFQRIRIRIERLNQEQKSESRSEPKSEPKDRSSPLAKKLTKKPACRNTLEPVGSDFTSGASLATADAHNNGYRTDHAGIFEGPSNSNGLIEVLSSLADNTVEKAEDPQSGKGMLPKFGRRTFLVDEDRRSTYSISIQPEDRSESICTTFEGDKKQLIPVGLSGEFSYARSLARFAANLGPPAWRIASKRIEQVLPPGFKYGRGWIGEYEPLPSLFVVDHRTSLLVSRSKDVVDTGKHNKFSDGQASVSSYLLRQPSSDGKCATVFSSGGIDPPTTISAPQHIPMPGASGGPANMMLKRVESNCSSAINQKSNSMFQQQGRFPSDSSCSETVGVRKREPDSPSILYHKQENGHHRERPHGMEMGQKRAETHSFVETNQRADNNCQKQPHMESPASRPVESGPMGKKFLQSLPFKQPNSNGGTGAGLANGKIQTNTADSIRVSASPLSLPPAGAVGSFPQRQDQGLSDPVQIMKMLAERAQRLQSASAHPSVARPSDTSPRVDTGGNAAAAAASAWMAVGAAGFRPAAQIPATNQNLVTAESLCNGTRVFYPQAMPPRVECPGSATKQYQPEKEGLPFQAFAQPIKVNSEAQVQNRPVGFPQFAANDLSRFQMQAHWRDLTPQTQHKQKQDTLPPDLNVAFPSPADSQQPDLALQL